MRTYKCTLVTLDTLLSIPCRNGYGCTTLLICSSASSNCPSGFSLNADTGRESPSIKEIGSIKSLTILTVFGRPLSSAGLRLPPDSSRKPEPLPYVLRLHRHQLPCSSSLQLRRPSYRRTCSFHELYCLIDRHNVCKFEECRL